MPPVRVPVRPEPPTKRPAIDPRLQPLADQLVDVARSAAKRAFAADAGRATLAGDASSLERAFAGVIAKAPKTGREAARTAVLAKLDRKRLVPVDLRAPKAIEAQAAIRFDLTKLLDVPPAKGFTLPPGSALDIAAKAAALRKQLGAPRTEVTACPDGTGRFRHFEHGSVYWSPGTGAQAVFGAIRQAWADHAWERGELGYPTSDEIVLRDGIGRVSHFERGSIFWRPERGAFVVARAVMEVYAKHDFEQGPLGYPVEHTGPDAQQRFEGGEVRSGGAHFPRTKLVTRLLEVEMLDETDDKLGYESGVDTMLLGGSVLDQRGRQARFGPIAVGAFDEDERPYERRFNGRALVASTLTDAPGWPKTYVATLLLAESDGGDFAEDLGRALDEVAAWAKRELAKVLQDAGESIGGALGGVIGKVLGEVLTYVIDQIAGWFDELFADVVLRPMVHKVTVKDVWQFDTTKDRRRTTVGGGGTYAVTIDFALR